MKARATLLVALVLSLALAPLLVAIPVHAQGQYTERIDVYTAGQSGLWSVTLDRLGAHVSGVSSVDSTTGLTSYRLVAMSSGGETSDTQVFGVNGYNLLQLPSNPSQGLFLVVNASSSSAASSAAADFEGLFGTTFTLVSSTPGSWTYQAPVDFVNVALPTLFKLVPAAEGGFAGFVPRSTFASLKMPFMVLTGSYNGSGFSHSISFGAVSSSILTTSGTVSLSEIIGSNNATVTTAVTSGSSLVVIHSLDGVITSSDAAKVVNNISNFSGSYTLSVNAGKSVTVNATVSSQPPVALAYRLLDHGTINDNQSLAVTVVVANTGKTGSIENMTLNDNWWQSYPNTFQFVSGNYSFTVPTLGPGSNETQTYVLKVLSATASEVVVPEAVVKFGYYLSTGTYAGHATLGRQLIELNKLAPSLNVVVKPSISSGSPLGTPGKYVVTVTNTGNSPALNVKLDNYSISSIAESGGTATISVPIDLSGLASRNLSRTFSVQYSTSGNAIQNVTANEAQLMLSHSSMVVPFLQVALNDSLTAKALSAKTLLVTYGFTNSGKGTPAHESAEQGLPLGVGCSIVSGAGNCTAGSYSTASSSLTKKNNLNLTFGADNYALPPANITATYQGAQFHYYGGAFAIPAGLALTKSFAPGAGFPGSNAVATIQLKNAGTLPVYNATLSSGFDIFDTSSNSSEVTIKTFPVVGQSSTTGYTYAVTLLPGTYGNLSGVPVTMEYLFAGTTQSLSFDSGAVTVYHPVTATIHSSPSIPEENHDFTLTITVANPAPVSVSNVKYTLTLPDGVSVVSGATVSDHKVTITIPGLEPNTNQNVSLKLSTDKGLTIDTSSSHLTFQYSGSTLNGIAPTSKVVVSVDTTTRYTIPIVVAIVAGLVAVVIVRRRVETPAKP